MKRLIKSVLRRFGYDLVRHQALAPVEASAISDLSPGEQAIVARVRPYTMTGVERIAALVNAVTHVTANKIPGDIAECGVWRGGSMMTVALTLLAQGDTSRSLYLYDTFEGMTAPGEHDKSPDGTPAAVQMEQALRDAGSWCRAGLEDVRTNIFSTGYPREKIHFVQGKVEETIPGTLPSHLALLRLDTDWYESTKHELNHLFPLLDSKGVLIVDDYGAWQGARKAVDEYFSGFKRPIYLHRIDATGRMLVGGGG